MNKIKKITSFIFAVTLMFSVMVISSSAESPNRDYSSFSINQRCAPGRDSFEFVSNMYNYVLQRSPDNGGYNYWISEIQSGRRNLQDVGYMMFFGDEYLNRRTSNTEFISNLYYGLLSRAPDSSGMQYWVSKLNSGTSRQEVYNNFAYGNEFSSYWIYY